MHTTSKTITDVDHIRVGHAQNFSALTGCTVVLCNQGAVCGVDQRGGAPGTRETDAVRPMHLVDQIHAIVLAGGSAYGLDAASGVMRYLEEHGSGYDTGFAKVPIVPSAILFDLAVGDAQVRPDAEMGYQACQNASDDPVVQGNVGAGTGATVGKLLGMDLAMKAGIGSSSIELGGGLVVGALAAVNALGDVVDPASGQILCGLRSARQEQDLPAGGKRFADTLQVMKALPRNTHPNTASRQNTVIGVVATNARLSKDEANKMAQMAQDGLARAIRPAHTMLDGDTIFALATGTLKSGDINLIGAYAAETFAQAIVQAVRFAEPAGGLPSAGSLEFGNDDHNML